MRTNAETPRREPGAFQKDSAASGASAAKVAHAAPETEPEAVCRDYWAAAKARYLRGDYPDYASPAWRALPGDDPRKLAGALAFAENWRRYNLEIADELDYALRDRPPLWQRVDNTQLEEVGRQIVARQERRRKEAA